MELSNGLFLSSSIDHEIEVYDHSFNKIKSISFEKQQCTTYSDSICEINLNETKIFLGSKTVYALLNLNNFEFPRTYQLPVGIYCNQLIEIKKENYIMMGFNGAFHKKGLLNNTLPENILDENIYITNGIKINENLVALSSNSIFNKGKDKLFIYNFNEKKKYKK